MSDGHPCPICHEASGTSLFVSRSPVRGMRGTSYQVFGCDICNHRWCHGDVSSKTLQAAYDGNFHDSPQQTATSAQSNDPVALNARLRAQWLAARGLHGQLLDVGAGKGYFVRAAGDSGFIARGIDLSPAAATAAVAIGACVVAGDFQDSSVEPASFSVLTMWDVLCGMVDPDKTVAQAARLLKSPGHLVLTVADGTSFAARRLGRFWPLMIPPINLHFFSHESLARLLARHGFILESFDHRGKRVNVQFAAQKAARMIHAKPLERLFGAVVPRTWAIDMNLGDIAYAVARKG